MKLVLIANLNVGLAALRAFEAAPNCEVALVILHPSLTGFGSLIRRFCAERGIDYLESATPNAEPVLERLRAIAPDYLFSIYNPSILKPGTLAIPSVSVNFHAAPLPRYRGTNTFSWAIINGEREYGVAWHIIEHTVDTGDIVCQRMFPLSGTETAFALCRRSFDVGVDLLHEEILPRLAAGLPRTPQPAIASTYYGLKDLPPNNGRVDFRWGYERLERFVRGLNYESVPNPFVHAVAGVGERFIHPLTVERAAELPTHREPGRLEAICDENIAVQCGDCVVRITTALDARRRRMPLGRLCEGLELQVGDVFGLLGGTARYPFPA